MPDRRGATLLEDLPGEIIDMILVRLPPKDVGRCRAVSTSWRSATSTPEFMLEHRRRQPLLPVLDGQGRPASLVVFRRHAGASNEQLWPFTSGYKNSSKNVLCATCDGFLIRCDGSRFYICNPVIRQQALLPWPQVRQDIRNTVIGFYRHHPTGEYRVLCVSSSLARFSKCSVYVLTVGSNEPRHVAMPTVSSELDFPREVLSPSYTRPPVYDHGSLHWCGFDSGGIVGGGGDITAFDTEAESFRSMRSPAKPRSRMALLNMKGALALWSSMPPFYTDIDVWVMLDYEAEIWDFKYRIDLSKVEASRELYSTSLKTKKKTPLGSAVGWFNGMIVLNERELLIMLNNKHVLRCDVDGRFLGMVNIGKRQYCMMLTNHLLQESIIPIPSHEMQGEDEEPPFPTGHV